MHFFTWVLALWLPIALQLNFKSLETVIEWLIILTNCLNRLQNRKYTLTLDIIKEDEELETTDEFYERIKKMNEQVKQKYECNDTNQDDTNQDDTNQEKDTTQLDLEQFNQEQYYKEMDEMQEQINKLSQLEEEESTNILDNVIQSNDSTPEEYKDIDHIVAKVNSVNNKVYIDESLE
jgi:hypothetical protein